MNFGKFLVSIGCFAAAIGIGSGKLARAGDFQSDKDPVSGPIVPCDISSTRGQFGDCERIGGHVRIDIVPRIQDTSGFGGPKASPVAVRMDNGTGPRGHLHLPSGLDELDPIRR